MRMSRILFFFILFLPFQITGQEQLTLDQAIRIGLESSFSIQIARNNVQIAQNNNTAGNAGILPRLDINANQGSSFQDRYQENSDESTSSVSGYPTHNLSAGAQLSWTLFDGLAMFIRKEKLGIYQQQSELMLRIEVENAVADIAYTYYSIALNEKLYKSYHDQMSLSRQRLTIAREKSRIGVGYELQELQSEVDYRADSARYLQQTSYLVNLKAELNRLLNREPQADFNVIIEIPVPQQGSAAEIIQIVKQSNPYLINAKLQVKVGELELSEAKSARFPSVNLTGSYNFSRTGTPDGQVQLYRTLGPAFGLGASINLFNGFNTTRRIKNASIVAENLKLNEQDLTLQLHSTAFKLVNTLNQAIELVKVEEKSVLLAQRNTEAAWEKYRLGAISDIELRESQNKLLDAQTRLVSAQMNAQAAEINIRLLTGNMGNFMK